MWQKQLGELYIESWNPTTPISPADVRGMKSAVETKDSLRMKGLFGAGDSPPNMAAISQASGQNPMEQEEEPSLMGRFEQWLASQGKEQ